MARKDALLRLHKSLMQRRDHLRKKLVEELAMLRGEDVTGDSADAAFDAGSDEMASALAEHDARELRKIEAALQRLKAGTYGLCEGCQKKIPVSRLNALPYTSLCIECQREMESHPGYNYRSGASWDMIPDHSFDDQKEVNLAEIEMDLSRNP